MVPKAGVLKKRVFYEFCLRLGCSKSVCFTSVASGWDAQKACVLRVSAKAGSVFYEWCLRLGDPKSICFASVAEAGRLARACVLRVLPKARRL